MERVHRWSTEIPALATCAVPQVPTRLPTVDTAIILPVWRPRCPKSAIARRSRVGSTPLSPNAGGARRKVAARQGPHRGSLVHESTEKMIGWQPAYPVHEYGGLVFAVMRFSPGGLAGLLASGLERLRNAITESRERGAARPSLRS